MIAKTFGCYEVNYQRLEKTLQYHDGWLGGGVSGGGDAGQASGVMRARKPGGEAA